MIRFVLTAVVLGMGWTLWVDPALQNAGGRTYMEFKASLKRRVERLGRELTEAGRRGAQHSMSNSAAPVARRVRFEMPSDLDPGSARATVLGAAVRLEGIPYIWGGEDPTGVDCSGLVVVAYRAAGVELPHRARLQYRLGHKVAFASLLPGDLVFFNKKSSGPGHVGLYVGSGRVIHASTGRGYVVIESIEKAAAGNGLLGARRILQPTPANTQL